MNFSNTRTVKVAAVVAVILVAFSSFVVVSDFSDGATSYNARVFTDADGTHKEYSGNGSTVKEIVTGALSSYDLVVDPAGRIQTIMGNDAETDRFWVVFQWQPPLGWKVVALNNSSNNAIENGTSYYVTSSEAKTVDGVTTYTPPDYKPIATAYFFIKFIEDYDTNDYITSFLTEQQRKDGFWISGDGSTAADAFKSACAGYGINLKMGDGWQGTTFDPEFIGWLYGFFGLGDEQLHDGKWRNWSQFHWDGSWTYSETLGHYDPGVCSFYALVRQTTYDENASANTSVTPSDIPNGVYTDKCTVKFVDSNGTTIQQQIVRYMKSATPPVSASWDKSFANVLDDITVRALDYTIPDGGGGDNPQVTVFRIVGEDIQIRIGDKYQYTASAAVSLWSSSDTSVATVDSDGLVTAISPGKTNISISDGEGGKDFREVTVLAGGGTETEPNEDGGNTMTTIGISAVAIVLVTMVAILIARGRGLV